MAKPMTAPETGSEGVGSRVMAFPQRTRNFMRDVRAEMKKVTKPSAKEVRSMTAVVLVTIALFGVYFFLIDRVLGFGIERVLQYFISR
jgi:preprotein translocase subunit SecE